MTIENDARIAAHYGEGRDLAADVRTAIAAAGGNPADITWETLAPIDQLHTGGPDATAALARRAGLGPDDAVLDVGGGIGGPARMLAATIGCRVTVLDLTPAFARGGRSLSAAAGLADRVTFETGDAQAMPLADASFDVVWTQHSTMNIPDKPRLYAEAFRVLRPGGRLAMHEIVAGPAGPLHFPVPWAAEPGISFLLPADALRRTIEDAGFVARSWSDVSVAAAAALAAAAARPAAPGPTLGIHVLLGEGFAPAIRSIARNVAEARAVVVEAVFERPA